MVKKIIIKRNEELIKIPVPGDASRQQIEQNKNDN